MTVLMLFQITGYLSIEKDISITGDRQIYSSAAPIYMWTGDLGKDGVGIGDGAINITDIMELVKSFNTAQGDAKYIPVYDFNMDTSVNISDVAIIATHFNSASLNHPQIK